MSPENRESSTSSIPTIMRMGKIYPHIWVGDGEKFIHVPGLEIGKVICNHG